MNVYRPEGTLIDTPENKISMRSFSALEESAAQNRVLEARALLCDSNHNLIVQLGCCKGIIPRLEAAVGIDDGSTRDIAILSRVNKPVCFFVVGFETEPDGSIAAVLSRKRVQEQCLLEYIRTLTPGDVLPARVTHMETFGCFLDIGCGITSLMPIDAISISRIAHPRDRFKNGQDVLAVVKTVAADGRITLSQKELLGTWEENALLFSPGETVAGIVRSVESYGIFVELTPNLTGLAEPREDVHPGQHASVYIKSLLPEKMKIKLIVVDAFDAGYQPQKPRYYIREGHIARWRYSPDCAGRVIETVF